VTDAAPAADEPQELTIAADRDVVRVRQTVRTFCLAAKLSLVDQTKAITAASELARNTLVHGGGGVAVIVLVQDGRRAGVRASFADTGPGIPDVEQALGDGWSSGTGLGLGLSGSRRLVDAFDIEKAVGEGTTVTMTKWSR
jgi:serine/threonine-protein kinase RsbT